MLIIKVKVVMNLDSWRRDIEAKEKWIRDQRRMYEKAVRSQRRHTPKKSLSFSSKNVYSEYRDEDAPKRITKPQKMTPSEARRRVEYEEQQRKALDECRTFIVKELHDRRKATVYNPISKRKVNRWGRSFWVMMSQLFREDESVFVKEKRLNAAASKSKHKTSSKR
jgi:hypothetical protein